MEMMNKLGPEVIRQIGNNAGALGLGGGGGDEGQQQPQMRSPQ